MISYGVPMPWRKFYLMNSSKMSTRMMLILSIPSLKARNLLPPPLSLDVGQDLPI
jgi:hypothetical protein